MTLFHVLSDRQAELLAKKDYPCLPNPSEVYCGTNYGQYKKDL